MQPLVPREAGGVTILSYHLIGAGTRSVVDVPQRTFRAQLAELRDLAQILSLDDAIEHLKTGHDLTARPSVVITFDDAFDNFRSHAWPLLQEFKIPTTLYVPVGFLEGTSGTPLTGVGDLPPVDWHDLRELASDSLLTIGSHSWRHADMRQLRTEALRDDLCQSRDRLQDRTNTPVHHFCYPQAKWSERTEREVHEVYRSAVVAGGRKNVAHGLHPRRLWRTPVRRDMPVRLASIVHSTIWLEEWAASHARLLA
jgi:peptidoglycan/xylan/chitin deacetylase (PgdA/CDA1 family)